MVTRSVALRAPLPGASKLARVLPRPGVAVAGLPAQDGALPAGRPSAGRAHRRVGVLADGGEVAPDGRRLGDASLAEADGTSWEGATTAYSMLRRLGDTDPALADSLAPAVAFFAPAVKKTKEKKTEEKKMPALAPTTTIHST